MPLSIAISETAARVRKRVRLREIPHHRNRLPCKGLAKRRLDRSSMMRSTTRYSSSSTTANARYTATASAYAVAPVPPSRRDVASSCRSARARASRFTRSRASCTRSEKVVSATSWRAVKRSREVSLGRSLASRNRRGFTGSATSGFHCRLRLERTPLRVPASARDRRARDHPRPRSPSAARPCAQPCLRFDVVIRDIGPPTLGNEICSALASLVPFFAASASFGLPTFTVNW